jgi:hypothetical protein
VDRESVATAAAKRHVRHQRHGHVRDARALHPAAGRSGGAVQRAPRNRLRQRPRLRPVRRRAVHGRGVLRGARPRPLRRR